MQNFKIVERDTLEILEICYLYSLGMTHRQIAEFLGTSIATINRKIQFARKEEHKWLEDRPIFCPPKEFKDFEGTYFVRPLRDLMDQMRDLFKNELNQHDKITVVPSHPKDLKITQRYAAIAAARTLERHLTENNKIGINWGTTTHAIAMELSPQKNPDLICVPVFGILGLGGQDGETIESTLAYESSGIAYLIAQKFAAPQPTMLSFPAFKPKEFIVNKEKGEAIQEFLKYDSSYQKVFGDDESHEGLIYQLDSLITSIGDLSEECAWYRYAKKSNYNKSQDDPKKTLEQLREKSVVGDIGQFFTTQYGFTPNSDDLINTVNKQVIGLDLEKHFISLVNRHHEEPNKGVGLMIVTVGEKKKNITIAAIKTGVNHLIIDENLAKSIISTQ